MDRIEFESVGLGCPSSADEFVWREGLETASEVVGSDEVCEMAPKLLVAVMVEAFDGSVLDGAVHPLDLTVGPRMVDLGEAVFDTVLAAAHGEHVAHVLSGRAVRVARRSAELDAVVGEHCVDCVRHRFDESDEEGRGGDAVGLLYELSEGELRCPVDTREKLELSFGGASLGDVDVIEPIG